MKPRLLLGLLLGLTCSAAAQTPAIDLQAVYAHPAVHPDANLTRQAFRLGQHFDKEGWQSLEASLRPMPRPVHSYLGFGTNMPLQSSLLQLASLQPGPATAEQVALMRSPQPEVGGLRFRLYGPGFGQEFIGESVSRQAVNQLYSHLGKLAAERRKTDYERLSDLLLRRATKVRKIKEALPVLQFMVDSTGWVQDVAVDRTRTKMGLTARSRKIILNALRDERFRALEARRVFSKPRPMAEKVHQLSSRFAYDVHRLLKSIHFRRQYKLDRCGPHTQKEARRMMRQQHDLMHSRP